MNNNHLLLTVEQLRVASQLAGNYGHRWVGHESAPTSAAEIKSATIAWLDENGYESRQCGIIAPTVVSRPWANDQGGEDEVPHIVHTTGSGRLTWEIDPQGAVQFIISRPTGDCLSCYVTSGDDEAGFIHGVVTGVYGVRHVDALKEALLALTPVYGEGWTEKVTEALEPLWASAFDAAIPPHHRDTLAVLEREWRNFQEYGRSSGVCASALNAVATAYEAYEAGQNAPHPRWMDDPAALGLIQ